MASARELIDGAELVRDAWSRGLEPDPRRTVVEWSEKFRTLTTRETSTPGPKRFRVTPYLKEIGEAMSVQSPVEEIVGLKGAQIGFSDLLNDFVGYVIDQAPAPIQWVFPTDKLAKRHSRQKLQTMIDHCPRLVDRIAEAKSRSASNTMTLKEFPGGILALCGANAPSDLRSMSAKYVLEDEIDAYPPTLKGEGDPVVLAERSTRNFAGRKIIKFSTPTIAGRSRIAAAFERTDRRRYFVPCPFCRHFQVLYWSDEKTGRKGIQWEGSGEQLVVWYECVNCRARIGEEHKQAMLEAGEWRAERPELSNRVRGYAISALYAPVGGYSWAKAVDAFLAAKDDPEQLRIFVNQTLGEVWHEKGDAPPWEDLYRRREHYAIGTVPAGGLVLTAGADVQQSRIELEVVAWGRRMESWSVQHFIIDGDTAGDEPWRKLEEVLALTYPRSDPANPERLALRNVCIDSGFATQAVYHFCRMRRPGFAYAVKGFELMQTLVGTPSYVDLSWRGRKLRRGVQLWGVGVSLAKRELYGWLRGKAPLKDGDPLPMGFCHFPEHGEEWFRQLTAEQLMPRKTVRNFLRYEWVKVHERNEVLDCRIYARAGAAILGVDRWGDAEWSRAAGAQATPAPTPPERSGAAGLRTSGYWNRWRRRPT